MHARHPFSGDAQPRVAPARPRFAALAAAAVLSVMAAVPVQADDKPDLTGVWGTYRGPGGGGNAFGPGPAGNLPLRPEAQRKVDEYRGLVAANGEAPGEFCLGAGMPASMLGSGGYPMEIVQHDDVIVVIYEAHTEVRHIYTGGPRVADEDLFPDRNGYSVGRWDGDTLIVETSHLKEAVDQSRFPHSADAEIVEHYTLETLGDGAKVLTAQMTMTDPAWYTEPVTAEKKWSFLPGTRLLPYECTETGWLEHLEQLRQQRSE